MKDRTVMNSRVVGRSKTLARVRWSAWNENRACWLVTILKSPANGVVIGVDETMPAVPSPRRPSIAPAIRNLRHLRRKAQDADTKKKQRRRKKKCLVVVVVEDWLQQCR